MVENRRNEDRSESERSETRPWPQAPGQSRLADCGLAVVALLDRLDPGTHRRIKGLRLVTAYGIAAMCGLLYDQSHDIPDAASLSTLAGGLALWASVSEARSSRLASSRDLALLVTAGVCGAVMMVLLTPILDSPRWPGAELTLVTGAFLVSYLKRYGILGSGIGSQIYIGQLLAYSAGLGVSDLPAIGIAGAIAVVAAGVPRLLSGPAEHPAPVVLTPNASSGETPPAMIMGLQAALAALAIVFLNDYFGLEQSVWAITACAYVVAGSFTATVQRIWRRILGTAIGVPLGLVCLPLVMHASLLVWVLAAVAMIVYAMSLPERYDIACGAFAFTLVITLAAGGQHSLAVLAARAWETLVGGAFGLATAMLFLPIRNRGWFR